MKILLYVSHFSDAGGAEKVVSLMANHWCVEHEVTILTETPSHKDFFPIESNVKREITGFLINSQTKFGKLRQFLQGLWSIRQVVKKIDPDVIISHIDMANIRMLIATMGLGIPVVVEDHNNPQLKSLSQPWKFLKPLLYRISAKVILLTPDLKKFYPQYLNKKIEFIVNPLNIPSTISASTEYQLKTPTFIALGSLSEQKGLDYMLEAFAKVSKVKKEWNLTILGEGKLRAKIEEHAEALGISDKLFLPGRVSNPYAILKEANIYLMSSRYEGFPVALCEAMGMGLACISFDCPTGPADIIESEANGLLVEYLNVDAFADAMLSLVNDKEKQERFAKEAIKINRKLDVKTIMAQWDKVLKEALYD